MVELWEGGKGVVGTERPQGEPCSLRVGEKRRPTNRAYYTKDIKWDEGSTVKYPLICTSSGIFAGLFGVGGGIVKGPLMLEMGVQPAVASATAAPLPAPGEIISLFFGRLGLRTSGGVDTYGVEKLRGTQLGDDVSGKK